MGDSVMTRNAEENGVNPYLGFVEGIEAGVARAAGLPAPAAHAEPVVSDRRVLLFSPHPDDECITGLLPLRLMRESGFQVVNVPVTHGSNAERRSARDEELRAACAYLGWHLFSPRADLAALQGEDVVQCLSEFTPEIIFMPHAADWNSRHIAVHQLVMEALAAMPPAFSCKVVETEYWGAMDDPNLMVEGNAELVAELVAATALHAGEVERNPYHLLLPAWMQDNVRRGGERIGGQGAAAPRFTFATLYRLREWRGGSLHRAYEGGRSLPLDGQSLGKLF